MATIQEQIQALQDEIHKTQKNKATNAHIGKLKAKMPNSNSSRKRPRPRRAAPVRARASRSASRGRHGGLGRFPSVGKSTLISKVTDAHSETGAYAFTTLTCIPGVMEHRGAKIQILDLPGLIKGAAEGKGREGNPRRDPCG